MTQAEVQFVTFTVGMALLSMTVVIPVGMALAWVLARYRFRGKAIVETLVSLPLVLPPVVTGLVLLHVFGRRSLIGGWLHDQFGIEVLFTWKAVILALSVMSLPLFVRATRAAFESVSPACEQIARTLGAGEWRVFLTVTVPLAQRGIVAGTLLAFARALGEFGATIMVAGNIPGQTTTISVAIYQAVQLGEDGRAWILAGVVAGIAFVAVFLSEFLLRSGKEIR